VTRCRRGRLPWAAAALLALCGAWAWAESPAVPADLQAAILTRTLVYDRALKARAGSAVAIGVLSKAGDKASVAAQEQMLRAFASVEPRSVHGLPLKVVSAPFKDRSTLLTWIDQEGIDAVYVTPGLGEDLAVIRGACEERKVASLGALRSFVEKGLAVAVVVRGETARLLVNLKAAEATGMDLDPKLLQLSEVIR
jgi:hypothetical protein